MKQWIYLDNAAATPLDPEVFESMVPYFTDIYGNPSGFSRFTDPAGNAVEEARETAAGLLGASPREIYFTGGGTESDNWALKGAAFANREKGRHIITTKIEHPAVLKTCQWLEKKGFDVTYLDVDENGVPDLETLAQALRPDTILISVMYANNEIGTLEPIREIGALARERDILFHTDAVQAYGHVPIDVGREGIDLLSASGHKLNGPKGVGLLYIRQGTKIESFLHGGEQERGKRAGTLNTTGIVGFGTAIRLAADSMEERTARETALRDHLIDRILTEIPDCRLNGSRKNRLPGNVNISFRGVESESLLIRLDQEGICASAGSACSAGSLDPSHVLLAIGLPRSLARGSLRLTLSADTTMEEIDYVADKLKEIVAGLRGRPVP